MKDNGTHPSRKGNPGAVLLLCIGLILVASTIAQWILWSLTPPSKPMTDADWILRRYLLPPVHLFLGICLIVSSYRQLRNRRDR